MELTSEAVESIFRDSLFNDGENTDNHIPVEGIVNNVGFHSERLESHKEDVRSLLEELPENFREDEGGGWSFLNACNDKHGNQWTGYHQTMEQLFQLGIALGLAKWLMPKEFWSVFPGGVPYVVILSQNQKS